MQVLVLVVLVVVKKSTLTSTSSGNGSTGRTCIGTTNLVVLVALVVVGKNVRSAGAVQEEGRITEGGQAAGEAGEAGAAGAGGGNAVY